MQEEYLIEKMIKGKTEKEIEVELMETIIETKEMLKIARCNFEYAEDDLIDYYTYQIKAHQSKLDYLIKIAKRKGIVLDRVSELKARISRLDSKKNMAGWEYLSLNKHRNSSNKYYYFLLRWYREYKYSYIYLLYMYAISDGENSNNTN